MVFLAAIEIITPHTEQSLTIRTLHQTLLAFVKYNIEEANRRHSVGFDLIQLEHEYPEFKKMILKISKFYKIGKFDRNNADIVPTLEYDGRGGQALIHLECVAAEQLLMGMTNAEPPTEIREARNLADNYCATAAASTPHLGMAGKGEKGLGGGIRVTLRRLRML